MAANLIPTPSSPLFQPHHYTTNTSRWSPLIRVKAKAKLPTCSVEEAGITIENAARGCKACGREEVDKGCNGEGRIQGGIATVPGFGWWPIKAYRPCPGFVEAGGRYRRRGQSMDEVAWGRTEREPSTVSIQELQSSKKKQMSQKSKQ